MSFDTRTAHAQGCVTKEGSTASRVRRGSVGGGKDYKEYQLWVYAVNNPGVGGLDHIRNNVCLCVCVSGSISSGARS